MTLRTDAPVDGVTSKLRPARVLPGGRLRVDGIIARTGIQIYANPDGSPRREYRPPAEVFAPAALASFGGAPVTDDHPRELLSIHDTTGIAVGAVVGDPRRDGDHVVAELTLWDAGTISKMRAGKVALSCGYDVDLEMTAGVSPDGERYDAIQRNVRGNHLAVVDHARAGSVARLRVDCDCTGSCGCNDDDGMVSVNGFLVPAEEAAAIKRADDFHRNLWKSS